MTYDSYPLSSKAFCVLWFLSTAWYLILNLFRAKLINFFRLRHCLESAHYIQIETPRKVLQMLQEGNNEGGLVSYIQALETQLRATLGFNVFVATVKIQTSLDGRRFFEFQSTRYTYQNGTFQPATLSLGTDVAQLLAMAHGLSSKEALDRLEWIGPNFIAVHVPHFAEALWQE